MRCIRLLQCLIAGSTLLMLLLPWWFFGVCENILWGEKTGFDAVNSFVSITTLWAVAWTLFLQYQSTKHQRADADRQAFDSIFFQALSHMGKTQSELRFENDEARANDYFGSLAADNIRNGFAIKICGRPLSMQELSAEFRDYLKNDVSYAELFPFIASVNVMISLLQRKSIPSNNRQHYIEILRANINSSWLALLRFYALDERETHLRKQIDELKLAAEMHRGPVRERCKAFYSSLR